MVILDISVVNVAIPAIGGWRSAAEGSPGGHR
jgi:hypothetical protein